jgi:hypothetical protein
LDSQEAAARRGLSDLQNQIGTQQARDVTDYALSQGQVQQQAGWNQQDLSQQRARGGEDYQRNVQMLTRRYGQLGQQQLQGANNAGVIRGGALLQSAAKRAENMALDRQPLDTNYQRFLADNSTQQARSQAGVTDRLGRLALDYAPPDASNPLGGRRYQDRTTQLTQAQRELAFFGQDIGNQRAFQAAGSGWDPGQGPTNEYTKNGQTYRVVREGNQSVAYLPTGKVLWKRPYRG